MTLESISSHCLPDAALSSLLRAACEQHNNQPLYLDESRKSFITEFGMCIHDLLNDKLLGNNQCRHLLLGLAGVGKTEMLKALLEALDQLRDDRLITLYVNFDETLELPSTLILKRYSHLFKEQVTHADLPNTDDWGLRLHNGMRRMDYFLTQRRKYVVLVLDKLQCLYECSNTVVGEIFRELTAIGDSCKGRVYSVITDTYSRQLCHTKLDVENRMDYSASQKTEQFKFDPTKYTPLTLRPMQTAWDIEGVRAKLLDMHENLRDRSTETLFVATAGVPGAFREGLIPISLCVDEYFSENDEDDWANHSIGGASQLMPRERYVLEKLYFSVVNTHRSDCPFDVVKPVPYIDFYQPVNLLIMQKRFDDQSIDSDTMKKAMEVLKNRGVIVQDDEHFSIAFGAPSVFYTVGEHLPTFVRREIFELRFPVSTRIADKQTDKWLAVSTALRLLWVAAHGDESILGMKLLPPANYIEKVNVVTAVKRLDTRRMYKEASVADAHSNADDDRFGADGFVVDDDRCTVCRIQVNLAFGVSSSRLNAYQVIDGFTRERRLERATQSFRLLLDLTEATPIKQKLFVLSDKLVDGATKKALLAKDIRVIHATDMPAWPRKLTAR